MSENSYEEGRLLLIDKPANWTSFDVVKKLRNILRVKKIGHAGTLDPLATGLLIIGTGKFTKKLNELQGLDKTYEGIIGLGKTTPSYDLETAFDSEKSIDSITVNDIESVRQKFLGPIAQIPPAHSAVKINGERAYKKARKKENVVIEPRNVEIKHFELDTSFLPDLGFQVHVTKGTYIRSLAHDFGQELEVGAYLKKLVRTSVGPYLLKDAQQLADFLQPTDESN